MGAFDISLLIPAYNSADLLPDVLLDAKEQTVPFRDIVVFDDASTDNTAEVAKAFGARVVVGNVNCGAGAARNQLLRYTTSHWLHYHDADDRLSKSFNETMMQHCAADSDRCVICAAKEIDISTGDTTAWSSWSDLNTASDTMRYFLQTQCAMVVGVYPRSQVEAIGGFREDVRGGEDYDFHVRLAQIGARFIAIDEPLVTIRRRRPGSFTVRKPRQYLRDNLRIIEGYASVLDSSYHDELAYVAMDLGWRLYEHDDRQAARKAVALARDLGRVELLSTSKSLRLVSRVLGIDAAFKIRALKNMLLPKRNERL